MVGIVLFWLSVVAIAILVVGLFRLIFVRTPDLKRMRREVLFFGIVLLMIRIVSIIIVVTFYGVTPFG